MPNSSVKILFYSICFSFGLHGMKTKKSTKMELCHGYMRNLIKQIEKKKMLLNVNLLLPLYLLTPKLYSCFLGLIVLPFLSSGLRVEDLMLTCNSLLSVSLSLECLV